MQDLWFFLQFGSNFELSSEQLFHCLNHLNVWFSNYKVTLASTDFIQTRKRPSWYVYFSQNLTSGSGVTMMHIDYDSLFQTEDRCHREWLNPGPMVGRFWGGFSKSKGVGAGDPVYFPPWSLLGSGLNNKAPFYWAVWGSLCTNTSPLPPTPLSLLF